MVTRAVIWSLAQSINQSRAVGQSRSVSQEICSWKPHGADVKSRAITDLLLVCFVLLAARCIGRRRCVCRPFGALVFLVVSAIQEHALAAQSPEGPRKRLVSLDPDEVREAGSNPPTRQHRRSSPIYKGGVPPLQRPPCIRQFQLTPFSPPHSTCTNDSAAPHYEHEDIRQAHRRASGRTVCVWAVWLGWKGGYSIGGGGVECVSKCICQLVTKLLNVPFGLLSLLFKYGHRFNILFGYKFIESDYIPLVIIQSFIGSGTFFSTALVGGLCNGSSRSLRKHRPACTWQ